MIISFKINQDYIANVHCINRDKPEILCSGKCVLKQRFNVEEEKEKKESPRKYKDQKEVVFYIVKYGGSGLPAVDKPDMQNETFTYQTPFTSSFVKGIFRPPKLITV